MAAGGLFARGGPGLASLVVGQAIDARPGRRGVLPCHLERLKGRTIITAGVLPCHHQRLKCEQLIK